jgi:hypothetical protein
LWGAFLYTAGSSRSATLHSLCPSVPPSLRPSAPPPHSLLPSLPPSLLSSIGASDPHPSVLASRPPSLLPSLPPSLRPTRVPSPLRPSHQTSLVVIAEKQRATLRNWRVAQESQGNGGTRAHCCVGVFFPTTHTLVHQEDTAQVDFAHSEDDSPFYLGICPGLYKDTGA